MIDQWFLSRVDQSRFTEVQGTIDPYNKVVWWRYPTFDTDSPTVFDDLIGYSWRWNRWVTATVQTAYLGRVATPGYVLDAMDAFGPLDSIEVPFDSRFWQGGQPVFAALDENFEFGTFTGNAQQARITTATINSPVSGIVGWATPIDDATTSTLRLGVSDRLADPIVWKPAAGKVSGGRVPMRGRGLNVAFRWGVNAGEDWSFAKGIDHIKSAGGGVR